VPSLCVVPVAARDRVWVQDVAREEELAERQRAHSADHAGLEVEVQRTGELLAALSPVVKHVGAAELRVVVAAVLADAPDAVLIAHHFLNLVPVWLPHWPA
jgi:stage V sporulation protein SpoVS